MESKNEEHTKDFITQEAQDNESTLGHVNGGWVQQVRKPPKFRLSERMWHPKEKNKEGTPSTSIKNPKLEVALPHPT